MAEAAILSDYVLDWRRAATTTEGHAFWVGAHPAMIQFEQRFPKGFPLGNDQQEAYRAEQERLMEALRSHECWDRWHINPEYAPVMETVKGAIRPNPNSPYYAAPTDHVAWYVRSEDRPSFYERYEDQADAVAEAANLAAGRPSQLQRRAARRQMRQTLWLVPFTIIAWGVMVYAMS